MMWQQFYKPHRIARNPLYNDDCLYTPGVVVFKSDVSFPERMEAKDWYQVDVITGYLTEMGFTVTPYSFTDTNDVASVTQAACDASDVIYIPTDNTAASNTEAIANVVLPAKVPVVAGEAGICGGCGVATLSISYYDLGYATGEMAAKVLTGEAKISELPVQYAPAFTKQYNAANCEALGVTVPEDYSPLE